MRSRLAHRSSRRGITTVEYAILLGLLVVASIGAFQLFGAAVVDRTSRYERALAEMQTEEASRAATVTPVAGPDLQVDQRGNAPPVDTTAADTVAAVTGAVVIPSDTPTAPAYTPMGDVAMPSSDIPTTVPVAQEQPRSWGQWAQDTVSFQTTPNDNVAVRFLAGAWNGVVGSTAGLAGTVIGDGGQALITDPVGSMQTVGRVAVNTGGMVWDGAVMTVTDPIGTANAVGTLAYDTGAQVIDYGGRAFTGQLSPEEYGAIAGNLIPVGAMRKLAWEAGEGVVLAAVRREALDVVERPNIAAHPGCIGNVCTNGINCFVAGTLVLTRDGQRPIETIRAGDEVWSDDPDDKDAAAYHRVELAFSHEGARVRAVAFEHDSLTDSLTTTDEHPFRTTRGWTNAEELHEGDLIETADGSYARIVGNVALPKRQRVYNFRVADTHTYFVGDGALLVHNANCTPAAALVTFASRDEAFRAARRDLGIPMSQAPDAVRSVPMTDRNGNWLLGPDRQPIMTREYDYTRVMPDGTRQRIVIQEHSAGHQFGQGGVGDQGPHFNVRPADNTRTGSVPGTLEHYSF